MYEFVENADNQIHCTKFVENQMQMTAQILLQHLCLFVNIFNKFCIGHLNSRGTRAKQLQLWFAFSLRTFAGPRRPLSAVGKVSNCR